MRVLVFGSTGLLGKALLREWPGDEVIGLSSRDADIRDASAVEQALRKARPHWIVLAAAYTDVDGCESNPALAFAVNRDGALNVARAAKLAGSRFMFLSSDYVFDGTKSTPYETFDRRNPRSVYGKTKAEAETALLESNADSCVLRTSWLFGVGGKCFPDTILKLAASRPALDVVNDQRGCPTYAEDLACAIIDLCHKHVSGIVHATNAGDCTWFEFAKEIVASAASRSVTTASKTVLTSDIRPVSTEQMARPAPRPAYSVLSAASLRSFAIEMPSWRDALQRYIALRG